MEKTITSITSTRFAQLVAAEAHLNTLLQCRYKPVEQMQAVLHAVAEAVEAQKGGNADA